MWVNKQSYSCHLSSFLLQTNLHISWSEAIVSDKDGLMSGNDVGASDEVDAVREDEGMSDIPYDG